MAVSSGTRLTNLRHSLIVGSISRSSMSATLTVFPVFFNSIMWRSYGKLYAHGSVSRGDFKKLVKTVQKLNMNYPTMMPGEYEVSANAQGKRLVAQRERAA